MADGAKASLDTSGWNALLDQLAGPLRVSLARSMAVAGGQILRDEAKARAPRESSTLAESIYLAYRETASTQDRVQYSVAWNASKAPHGHLLEFGHWQPFVTVKIGDTWVTTDRRRAQPRWIPAYPFLRPAFDSSVSRAMQAMYDRGRERLPQLLAQAKTEPSDANA